MSNPHSYLDYMVKMQRAFLSETLDLIKHHVPKSHYSSLRIYEGKSGVAILIYEGSDASDFDMDVAISLFQTDKAGFDTVHALLAGRNIHGKIDREVTFRAYQLTPEVLFRMFKEVYGR